MFATKEGKNIYKLTKHSSISTNIGYVKVKGNASPYDGNLTYWSTRMGRHPEMPIRVSLLLKKQKGKCTYCGLNFKDEDIIEIDHIIPKSQGGKDEYENWQLLHRHCHDSKTAKDGSYGNKSGCNSAKPKPLESFLWIDDMLVAT